ncbi:hypothetical protein F3Y22_tig00110392pilonHSYRG00084 [Hibiscus syriacus]|uniref:Uncharacterized protein n=1 Tax=Hibiscus syriacus TaxID=106335 RepID=A0A6A3AQJ3_HIBSY|nr:hypothetical protein F3Y22_tig00110392pilonHSYRG00084 [Hibiscus syriacus]
MRIVLPETTSFGRTIYGPNRLPFGHHFMTGIVGSFCILSVSVRVVAFIATTVVASDQSEDGVSVSHRTTSGDSPSSHGVDGWYSIFWSLRLGRGSGGSGEIATAAAKLSKYEELKPPVVPRELEPAVIPVAVEPDDSPCHANEDALIRKATGARHGTPGGSNDDMMDDLEEMIFGKKGGGSSEGAQDSKQQAPKDDLITF